MKLIGENKKILTKVVCSVSAVDVISCKFTRTEIDELVTRGGEGI